MCDDLAISHAENGQDVKHVTCCNFFTSGQFFSPTAPGGCSERSSQANGSSAQRSPGCPSVFRCKCQVQVRKVPEGFRFRTFRDQVSAVKIVLAFGDTMGYHVFASLRGGFNLQTELWKPHAKCKVATSQLTCLRKSQTQCSFWGLPGTRTALPQ